MLGAAIKSALGFRRSAVRPARAGRGVLSTVKAAGGSGALACASFRKLGAGVTVAAALPFCDSSDAFARMKPAGLWGSHVSVRCMSTGSDVAGATPLGSGGAAAVTGSKSTSGDSSEAPPFPKACAPPKVVLVKAGDKGRYMDLPIAWHQLEGLSMRGLLTALKADDVFGHKLKEVDFSDCSVELLKLPASADEPSAADEALDKVKELKGAKTVGAVWSTIATADAAQLCIRVRLPADAATAPSAARPLLAEWRGLAAAEQSEADVLTSATSVAKAAVRDSSITVEDEALLWRAPATNRILQKPLPIHTSIEKQPAVMLEQQQQQQRPHAVMLELIDAVDASAATPALHDRVWAKLQPAFKSTAQRTSAVMLTGVSGAGKTKTAFDIGSKYAFVVISRVHEHDVLTAPWQLLSTVTEKLQAQSISSAGASALPAAASRAAAAESKSAVGALLLMLSCHLQWALAVYNAAVAADAALSTSEAGQRVLREAVLRAQRNGTGYRAVRALFAAHLREVLDNPANVSSDGHVTISIDAAKARLNRLAAQLPDMPVVWCYDEVQLLLTKREFANFFEGSFDASSYQGPAGVVPEPEGSPTMVASPGGASEAAAAAGAAGASPAASLDGAVLARPSFFALGDDTAACRAELRRSVGRGWFYGLLVAMRHMIHDFKWGHLLCGSSLRLHRELLLAHSPAQGVSDSVDADVRLDAATIRRWFEVYLTPAAAAGLDDKLLAQLVGRPFYASCFFQQLYGMLDRTLPETVEPKAVVATALRRAVDAATSQAKKRVEKLWDKSFSTASGDQPQALVAWLYYLQRMGWGTTTAITPPVLSSEAMEAVQCGVLHVGRSDTIINLAEAPITAEAIRDIGDQRTLAAGSAANDRVVRALGRRVTGVFGDPSSKGMTAEDVISWTLLRSALKSPNLSLRDLLAPFLRGDSDLVPRDLADLTVTLHGGLHCGIALGDKGASRTFLDLLASPAGSGLLLHHTQTTAAGADIAFLAQRSAAVDGTARRQRLVIMQVRNAAETTAAKMLRSVDLGCWYPDVGSTETASHAAFRALMDAHPDWCDPVRVLMSARPWSEDARLTAAWINHAKVPQQPLVLAHVTKSNLGVDILQEAAVSQMDAPRTPALWWPSPIRHSPASSKLLSTLPSENAKAVDVLPSLRVRFHAAPGRDVHKAAIDAGPHVVIQEDAQTLLVHFEFFKDAFSAVAAAEAAAAAAKAAAAAAGPTALTKQPTKGRRRRDADGVKRPWAEFVH